MDPIETPMDQMSTGGMVHSLAAVCGDALPIAAVVLAAAHARADRLWASHRQLLWIAALASFGSIVVASATMGMMMPADGQLGPEVQLGWIMRVYAVVSVTWVGIAAWATTQSGT